MTRVHGFHRGAPSLDFVGTVGARASAAPEERLPDPAALHDWLCQAGLPVPARIDTAGLRRARVLREALHALVSASLEGRTLPAAALARVNRAARGGRAGVLRLDARGRLSWRTRAPLDLALGLLAMDGLRRLAEDRDRFARCELPGCGALLLSASRGERRRWCSMETCGNRAKVAAYRARRRAHAR